jgi:hypothetical protein
MRTLAEDETGLVMLVWMRIQSTIIVIAKYLYRTQENGISSAQKKLQPMI